MIEPVTPPPTAQMIDQAQDWFLRLRDDADDSARHAAFCVWRSADPRHAAAYDEVAAMWADAAALRAAFAPRASSFAPWASLGRPRLMKAAALMAASVAGVLLFGGDLRLHLLADHRTVAGETASIALPDGGRVDLNTGSAIALSFDDDARRVTLLQGEAAFTVAPDPARPFIVRTPDGEAEALGTIFGVRRLSDETQVTVLEGEVAARRGDAAVALGGGEQSRLRARAAAPDAPRPVDPAALFAWREGWLVIRNAPLDEAIAEIDRYSAARVMLFVDDAATRRVSARIALDDIDGGLRALAAAQSLSLTAAPGLFAILR